ncbi:hypothetical protein AA313_de0205882 [Arthrobotrys entomopaga]|nr:hypothetical protein AA313_de0205882 [Arthrobotrys entomopaga]
MTSRSIFAGRVPTPDLYAEQRPKDKLRAALLASELFPNSPPSQTSASICETSVAASAGRTISQSTIYNDFNPPASSRLTRTFPVQKSPIITVSLTVNGFFFSISQYFSILSFKLPSR